MLQAIMYLQAIEKRSAIYGIDGFVKVVDTVPQQET